MREFVSIHVGEQYPGVGVLLVSRPPTNALTRQTYRELVAAAGELADRTDIATVILFGGHEIFSVGDDIPELRTLNRGEAEAADLLRRDAINAIAEIPKPTVAAITGYALGAGLSLALAADWRVSGDNVKLGATEILAGLVPGGGGGQLLARVTGPARAKELAFSGRFVGARESLALGLVDELVAPDNVFDAAAAWASRFTDTPPTALAGAKALIDGQLDAGEQAERYGQIFTADDGG
ncbi:enoyl-CoA hydratase [Mycobacterium sp. CVI_P3]|uniref:Enoyl-CoA hydratase n=1 Tax=Mycobacterium pinniadriaticum TaxID=2994102 RepID=A0ABT3SLZ1_9MYCO|nr:enoyl-CoA hydratase [Mycobacterium pinniadriaticum]MCX2933940.1 enoyl-CoA hydratase [Mycobacterium pinniadriaticum]MCX2940362.1 enoyl-CoA hydratase [Mycobacterium pinniadriaticum]